MSDEPVVYIVDDDQAVRMALEVLVKSMHLGVETYGSAEEFLANWDPMLRGCLLLDVRMPGMSGLELLDLLDKNRYHLPVIVISAHGDVPMAVQAMKAGALTFLEKPCRDQELWEAVQEAIRWDQENRQQVLLAKKLKKRITELTPGETEVLRMLIKGKSNKSIALKLGLSVRTIEVRRAKVMKKMKAGSLAELVKFTLAVEKALGSPQHPCRNTT